MDLMQEHYIRELKDKSQRRDEGFDGDFFRNVISRNISWFTKVRSVVNQSTHLHDRSSVPGLTKRQGTANQLRVALERERVHYFVRGRSYGWAAQDDFMQGFRLLPAKLTRFLHQTVETPLKPLSEPPEASQTTQAEDEQEELGEAGQADADDELGALPTPAMVVAGRFIPGHIADDECGDEPSFNEVPANSFDL